jgi:DNA-3-methyladenine glycosylase II
MYRRVLNVDSTPVLVAVTQRAAVLDVTLTGGALSPAIQHSVTRILERLLGINVDLSEFHAFAARYPRLNQLAAPFIGFKPPRFATVFEGLVNGITCQQLSLGAGIVFLNRLADRYGRKFSPGLYAFPRPDDLAHLHPADLRPLGYSNNKARSIIGIARASVAGDLDLEALEQLDDQQCFERLVAMYGVGRWTAEYLRLRKKLDYDRVEHVLRKWKHYGGLIFFLLLLKNLDEAGSLDGSAARTTGDRRDNSGDIT